MPEMNRVPGAMRPLLLAGLFLLILLTVVIPPLGMRNYALLAGMPLLMLFWWTNTTRIASYFRYPLLFALLANFSQDISAVRLAEVRADGSFMGFWLFILPYLFTLFSVPAFLIYTFLKMRYTLIPRSNCNWVAVFGFVPVTTIVVLSFVTPITFSMNWLNLLFVLYALLLYVLFEAAVHAFSSPAMPGARLAVVAAFAFTILRYKTHFATMQLSINLPPSLLLYLQNTSLALLVYATARYLNSRVMP